MLKTGVKDGPHKGKSFYICVDKHGCDFSQPSRYLDYTSYTSMSFFFFFSSISKNTISLYFFCDKGNVILKPYSNITYSLVLIMLCF